MLTGCAQPGACIHALRAELLFGLSTPSGLVSQAAFDGFLDHDVTPRFPAGLTVLEGAGRWAGPNGLQVREASKVVLIVVPDDMATRARLDAVRTAYMARFRQNSVGLLLAPTCAAF